MFIVEATDSLCIDKFCYHKPAKPQKLVTSVKRGKICFSLKKTKLVLKKLETFMNSFVRK